MKPRYAAGTGLVLTDQIHKIYFAFSAGVLRRGLSCNTTFSKELWNSKVPLYSMKPSLRNHHP